MKIYHGDVLKFNMEKCVPEDFKKAWDLDDLPSVHIIGNLPFNISLPLIFKLLRQMSMKSNIFTYGRVPLTLTFQKEVGERLVSPESTCQRSRISIMAQYLCSVKYSFTIPGKFPALPQKVTNNFPSLSFSRFCICASAQSRRSRHAINPIEATSHQS
jgi:dimethyladenosine transferase 1